MSYRDIFGETLPPGAQLLQFTGDQRNGSAVWREDLDRIQVFRAWRTWLGTLYTVSKLATVEQIEDAKFPLWQELVAGAYRELDACTAPPKGKDPA